MLYGAIDIHKAVFQAVVLDPDTGELSERRFAATREELDDWAMSWQGKLAAVAVEATTGWRWVARELQERVSRCGWSTRAERVRCRGGAASRRPTGSTRAGSPCYSPGSCCPNARPGCRRRRSQRLRDQTRLRKALAGERTGWAQRLHALLTQEGWPCPRGRLLTAEGRRWVDALELDPCARAQSRSC